MLKLTDKMTSRPKEPLSGSVETPHKVFRIAVLAIALVVAPLLALTATGCEDFGRFPAPSPAPEKPERRVTPTAIRTADRAILTVYEHLLNGAESHEAKRYLAEFYAVSDNWSAEKELLQDGSSIWYITIDMTASEPWQWRPHWQQAGWFVFQEGRVIPSRRFQANALRIEADLQELSLAPDRKAQ